MKTFLLTGGLSPFASELALLLLQRGNNVVALHNHNQEYNQVLKEVSESENFCVVNVDSRDEDATALILREKKVSTVIDVSLMTTADAEPLVAAQRLLLGITSVLDAVRNCENVPNLVLVSGEQVYGENLRRVEDEPLTPTTFVGSGQMAVEAMTHSYAVSYRIPTVIARLPTGLTYDTTPTLDGDWTNVLSAEDAATAVAELADVQPAEPADVFNVGNEQEFKASNDGANGSPDFRVARLCTKKIRSRTSWRLQRDVFAPSNAQKELVTIRPGVLLYGARTWIGKQFAQLLEQRQVEYVEPDVNVTQSTDAAVRLEILNVRPSHVFFVADSNENGYDGDCFKLRENVSDNLYAPWLLASICEKANIHFTYVGSGLTPNEPLKASSCDAVKVHTKALLKHFASTLQCRLNMPINYEVDPQNLLFKLAGRADDLPSMPVSFSVLPDCLPAALDLALRRKTGIYDVVNPGTMSLADVARSAPRPLRHSDEFDKEETKRFGELTQLDSSRLEAELPKIRNVRDAVQECVQHLAK